MRHTLRMLAKSPGFAAVAIVTVALGIASATAIYSVASAVVFRPLPFHDEERLAWIWSTRPDRDRAFFSVPDFLDLKRANTTTADLAAITPVGYNVTGLGEPERVLGWRVSANLFSVLGAQPHLGRMPRASDDNPGQPPVVVLGHGYWLRRFGGDPTVVGRVLSLNGTPHEVVGVLDRGFLIPNSETDLVATQSLETSPRRADRGTNFLRGIARLKPGVTLAQAQREFAVLTQRLGEQYPDTNAAITAPRFVPLREEVVGTYGASLQLLLAAAGALLLIMCANLAGLLAVRALGRRRDAALCSALGASPGRLLRTYLAEGLIIAVAGGTLGVGACAWGLDFLLTLAPPDLPRASLVALDGRVLAVALGCTLLTGLGVGLAPALRLARTAPLDILKNASAASTPRSASRSLLITAQIALCTALLIGTGLLARSLHRLSQLQPGFVSKGVLTAQISLPATAYPGAPAVVGFLDEFIRQMQTLPGVTSASVTSVLPLTGMNTRSEFVRSDRPPARPSDTLSAANRFIGENYFSTVGIPLVAGRDFAPGDDPSGRSVVIIDRALAERHWPGENPIGKTIRLRDTAQPRELEIIGVVGTTKNFSLEESGTPTLYLPCRQMQPANVPFFVGRVIFVARTAGDPLALKDPVRRALRRIDANAAVSLRSFDEAIAWARAPRLFNLYLLGFFSAMAVLLAGVGLYAVTAQAVATRTREIGIRMALGADRVRIARDVLARFGGLVATGLVGGSALAFLLTPLIARMLFQTHAFDPLTHGIVAGLIATIALLATWLPTRRALRVDPLVALRSE
ncbi:MAG TPA: ABC transporter permease [Opitutaceae bacterium]|nr:ABC transporter permease [Opitutaceae bacterium]